MLVCEAITIVIDLLSVALTKINNDRRAVGYQEPSCNLQKTTPLGYSTIGLINSNI